MRPHDLAVAWAVVGLIAACDVPLEHFHRADAPSGAALGVLAQQAYVKASNTESGDGFGGVTLSADGATLAVSAVNEDSGATGINGNQASNAVSFSGAVYVLVRDSGSWNHQAYLKASNTGNPDCFGTSISLSADGSTLAVGAYGEDSAATGIGGDQSDNSASAAGAVYVFTRNGSTWSQQAYVKASNTGAGDYFGFNVALSGDGSTLAVGAYEEDSSATGVGGNQSDNSAAYAGAVYVFTRSDATWTQQAYIKASNTAAGDGFGRTLALSADGSTLAVSARFEDSVATGIGGNQADNSASSAGAIYVFTRSGTTWNQQAYVKASNAGAGDNFGRSLSLSADGSTLAVGAIGEGSLATGVEGNQLDNSASSAGAVYVFTRSGTTWRQQAYLKASNTGAGDGFGRSVALAGDGSTLAVGAELEDSAATGIDGDQADNSAAESGAAYLFMRDNTAWSQRAYLKASNTGAGDVFGTALALSGDGATLAVGAGAEDSAATGIDGNRADDSAPESGAVYVFSVLR